MILQEISLVYLSICCHVHYWEDDMHILHVCVCVVCAWGGAAVLMMTTDSQCMTIGWMIPAAWLAVWQYPEECSDHPLENAHGDKWMSIQHTFHAHHTNLIPSVAYCSGVLNFSALEINCLATRVDSKPGRVASLYSEWAASLKRPKLMRIEDSPHDQTHSLN